MSERLARIEPFEVVSNTQVACNLWRMVMRCPAFAADILPGQFINIRVPQNESELLRIPVSFSAVDRAQGTIEILYATIGKSTRIMSGWKPGFRSDVVGVLGNGWKELKPQGKALLVAGGCGIAPVLGLAQYFEAQDTDFDLIIGARSREYLYGKDDAQKYSASNVVITTDDGSCGVAGFTTDAAQELLAEKRYSRVYTCGPQVMMAGIARLAKSLDIACEVSLERLMSCAFGVCNTCNVEMADGSFTRCCKQGPVYMSDEVAW